MTSTYAVAAFQQCPRWRFAAYEEGGSGNEPLHITLKDSLDRTLKPALSRLIVSKGTIKPESHIANAKAAYSMLLELYGGLKLEPDEDAAFVRREQAALIEGIIWASYRGLVKDFAHLTDVTIPEPAAYELAPGVTIECKPDLVVQYETGRAGVFWNIVSGADRPRSMWTLRHSIVPAVLAFKLDIVEVRSIIRGVRRRNGGIMRQSSSLIGIYDKKKFRAHTMNRGKNFSFPWDDPNGIRDQVASLNKDELGKHFGLDWAARRPEDPSMSSYKYSKHDADLQQMISRSELAAWKVQVIAQEQAVQRSMDMIRGLEGKQRLAAIHACFGQHRFSCKFCDYTAACDQGLTEGLADSGIYRKRERGNL